MNNYIKTGTILDKILAYKVEEVQQRKTLYPLSEMESTAASQSPARDVFTALQCDTVALIAEIKKASPSKGVLIQDFDPVRLGQIYVRNGAAMISVLTDERFFQGHLDYLTQVRDAVSVPVLRKEFIIDPYQVLEARAAGADAVLLIVGALDDSHLSELSALVSELGMTALVEVHTETEMERALGFGARLVGVNNRDLKTFDVDLQTTARLAAMAPNDVILVAESGIMNVADVAHMGRLGARAVLVGEALVKAGDDLAATVRSFSSQLRP